MAYLASYTSFSGLPANQQTMNSSNSSALFATVLLAVGGLAFGSHYYLRAPAPPKSHTDKVPVETPDAPPEIVVVSPLDHLAAMRDVEQKLWQRLEETRRGGDLDRLVDKIATRQATLADDVAATEAQRLEARRIALRSAYAAARVDRVRYGRVFETLAASLVEDIPGSEDAAQADYFRIHLRYDLSRPIRTDLHRDLEAFAETYPDSPHAAALFSAVSSELWQNNQVQSAAAVLERGIELLAGKPGVARLVNELVEQGHRKPPEPRYNEKSFKAYLRAVR